MAVTYALATQMQLLAGANINTAAVDAGDLEDFGEFSEGIVNSESGYNWSDWYTAVGSGYPDVCFLLVHAAGCLGAIHIINYDMSGFTNIQEAVARQNVLFELYKRDIALLKEEGKKDFIRVGGGSYP